MKCTTCRHGETAPGTATVTLERGGSTVVVKGVPAQVCRNCSEEYLDEGTAEQILKTAEEVAKAKIQVQIRQYAVA